MIQLSHDDVADEGINHSGHRRSHALTQALGGSSLPIAVEPHIILDAPLRADETLLLCSDGLTDMVDSNVIGHVLNAADESIRSVHDLADKAFSAGGARQRFCDRRKKLDCSYGVTAIFTDGSLSRHEPKYGTASCLIRKC